MPETSWQAAFVAMTVALGDTVADALAGMSEADGSRAASTAAELSHPRREIRAKTLAAELAEVALALEDAKLA